MFCSFIGIKIFILITSITLIRSDCLSEDTITKLKTVYEEILKVVSHKTPTNDSFGNETNIPSTADELAIDKEQIKKLPSENGKPVNIKMKFFIDDINSISDVNMDYRVDFYYLQYWSAVGEDCSMYKKSLIGRNISLENVTKADKLIINKEYFTLFWLPDTMISNAKQVQQQSEKVDTILLQIYFNKEKDKCKMEYLARFYSIVSCPMDFHDAPIDTQICSIQMRSFAFNEEKIQLKWFEMNAVEYNPGLRLLEHDFQVSHDVITSQVFHEKYSTLRINIKFERKLANKMVGVYTPSILIVLITFCSFWLGINSTPERVTIGITALLALVTQFNDVRQSLPPTSYITEIDKWMIMCMIFVAAQLVQCTLVDYVYHHQKHSHKLQERAENVINHFRRLSEHKKEDCVSKSNYKESDKFVEYHQMNGKSNIKFIENAFKKNKETEVKKEGNDDCISVITKGLSKLISVPMSPDKPEFLPMRIDAASRILFPLFFGLICLFYWPTMLFKAF